MQIFPAARAAPPRFGCFGKLPSYADFLSLNIDGPEPQALAAWLQEGIGAAPSIASAHPEQFIHYVWRPERGRRTLVGVLWPSADAAGRRFPFTIFTTLPQQQLAGQGARTVLAAESIRTRIHELFTQVMRMARIRDQYVAIGESQVPGVPESGEVQRAWTERAEKATLRREDVPVVAGHVVSLTRFAGELLAAPEIPDFALRLALLSADADTELATWTQVLYDRLREPELDVGVFLRFARTGPSAYLFHRGLDAPDLAFLLAPSDDYRGAQSIGFRPGGGGPMWTRIGDALQRAWKDRPPNCRSVIEVAAGASPEAEATTGESCESPGDRPAPRVHAAVSAAAPAIGVAEEEPDTGEILVASMPSPAPGIVEVAQSAAPARGDRTGAIHAGSLQPVSELSTADIAARIDALAADAVLPGRLVRASAVASASVETVETSGGGGSDAVLLYLDESGTAALLTGMDAVAVRAVERRIAAWREARELLAELGRRHRGLEERLERALNEAGARAARPGTTA